MDEKWLTSRGIAVRSPPPPAGLVERLKFVAGLVAGAPERGDARGRAPPRLLWRNERHEVMSLALPADFVIGRDADCGLTFADTRVSRRHCRITLLRGVAWLADMASTNGTFLNDRRVTVPEPLRDGDVLGIGGQALAYVAEGRLFQGGAPDRSDGRDAGCPGVIQVRPRGD